MHTFIASLSAFWLGILTSVHPCPFATNIAALFFIVEQSVQNKRIAANAVMYVFGRTLVYSAIGVIAVSGIASIPETSNLLQFYMSKLIGPLLLAAGVLIMGLIPGIAFGQKTPDGFKKSFYGRVGPLNSFILGAVLALTFCPASAALFFGGLIPLAIKSGSNILMPVEYGIGSGLPVLIFALLISKGYQSIELLSRKIKAAEKWASLLTGAVFIVLGLYYSFKYVFELF